MSGVQTNITKPDTELDIEQSSEDLREKKTVIRHKDFFDQRVQLLLIPYCLCWSRKKGFTFINWQNYHCSSSGGEKREKRIKSKQEFELF